MTAPLGLEAMNVDTLPVVQVGPGCTRIDLPSGPRVRTWIVDMEPGSTWPHIDSHGPEGESVFVVRGEVIEGDTRHSAGTYLNFRKMSSHRPRTEVGVRLFGFNLLPAE